MKSGKEDYNMYEEDSSITATLIPGLTVFRNTYSAIRQRERRLILPSSYCKNLRFYVWKGEELMSQ
jgi:hypothetical protein